MEGKKEENRQPNSFLRQQSLNEFQEWITAFYEKDDNDALIDLFKIFDRDGNGTLSSEELRTVMTSISHEKVPEEDVKALMDDADTNNDGKISLAEFIVVMKKNKSMET